MNLEITGHKDKHEYISDKGVRSVVYQMDCMEGLKQIPDKYFELAIVDPPYFDGPQKTGYYKGTKQVVYLVDILLLVDSILSMKLSETFTTTQNQ